MRPDIEAAAKVVAAELEFTVPFEFEGKDGWYAVAEKVLGAADKARAERES